VGLCLRAPAGAHGLRQYVAGARIVKCSAFALHGHSLPAVRGVISHSQGSSQPGLRSHYAHQSVSVTSCCQAPKPPKRHQEAAVHMETDVSPKNRPLSPHVLRPRLSFTASAHARSQSRPFTRPTMRYSLKFRPTYRWLVTVYCPKKITPALACESDACDTQALPFMVQVITGRTLYLCAITG
jgi:hypothetical protein